MDKDATWSQGTRVRVNIHHFNQALYATGIALKLQAKTGVIEKLATGKYLVHFDTPVSLHSYNQTSGFWFPASDLEELTHE